tara:strand:+ start:72 stop:266 length:195 start_codon:yes stop_codon:yes gene_type:complete
MKKFNQFESNLIEDALRNHIQMLEAEVLEVEAKGKRSIFAEGFFTMMGKELIDKVVNDMTRKQK